MFIVFQRKRIWIAGAPGARYGDFKVCQGSSPILADVVTVGCSSSRLKHYYIVPQLNIDAVSQLQNWRSPVVFTPNLHQLDVLDMEQRRHLPDEELIHIRVWNIDIAIYCHSAVEHSHRYSPPFSSTTSRTISYVSWYLDTSVMRIAALYVQMLLLLVWKSS